MFHLAANPHYGFFRDELYFIVCGRRPAFGYVDQPPLVPLLAAGSQLFGTSLFLLRAVPALCAGVAAAAAARLARAMGGGFAAAALAAVCTALAPVLAAFGTVLGPDSVQLALWPLAILAVAEGAFGLAALAFAVAALAKYSALIAAVALLAGVGFTDTRRGLLGRGFWIGAAAGAALLLPNALWQWLHGWPMLELLRNGQTGKNVILSPGDFLVQQLLLTGPLLSIVWVAGLVWCLVRPAWRWLGIGALVLLALMIVLHGKAYYPAAIYPALFAAGAVALCGVLRLRLYRAALVGVAAAAGIVLLPMVMPVLPEGRMLAYDALLARAGIGLPETEHHRRAALGQLFADMHGWQHLADTVAALRAGLPDDVRARARIYASNYGEAAAIDVLSPPGMPPVIAGHNQYWVWGPRDWDGSALIDVGGDLDADRRLCGSASVIGRFGDPWVMPYEDQLPIVLCRDLRVKVRELWPKLKKFE